MITRLQQGLAGTIRVAFTQDGIGEDPTPDSALVTLTRSSDGTELGPYEAYDYDAPDAGEFSHTLTAQENATLDELAADWTVTYEGEPQTARTIVEIVGGHLFTIGQARAMKGLEDTDAYPAEKIAAARVLAEQMLEDACNDTFVPRFTRERRDIDGGYVTLKHRRIRALRAVAVDGVALSAEQVAALRYRTHGVVWVGYGRQADIAYEHGLDRPPERAHRAALLLAKDDLIKGPVTERALQRESEFGPINLAVPGMRGSWFGIPEVDAFVQQNRRPSGFA